MLHVTGGAGQGMGDRGAHSSLHGFWPLHLSGSPFTVPQRGMWVPGWGSESQGACGFHTERLGLGPKLECELAEKSTARVRSILELQGFEKTFYTHK